MAKQSSHTAGPSLTLSQIADEAWTLCRTPVQWWLAISAISLTAAPDGWKNLATRTGLYFDAGNYTTIANTGYTADGLAAFYPLWPLLMRGIGFLAGFVSEDPLMAGWISAMLATSMFGVSTVLFVRLTERFKLTRYRSFVLAIMILSPLSVFRVLPFTESLFSLFLMLLVADLTDDVSHPKILRSGLWAFMLSITRPMFPFLMISALLLILFTLVTFRQESVFRRITLKRLSSVFVCAPLGYVPFGLICSRVYGDFWKPFVVQAQWGRKFGFHWDLIFRPKVINGSNEVLVWDLIGFYAPIALLAWGLWYFVHLRNKTQPATGSMNPAPPTVPPALQIGFLLAALIGCAHTAAAFLTFERFMSIGRHVLGNPLPFFGLLVVVQCIPPKQDQRTRRILGFVVFASSIFLAMWWFRFAKDQWIG
ncbi:MAG: hypothetical protein NTV34_15020 [Proteobacteria bacterium]|nr:hypothetical protein [Pseudomonadota bacterium]